MKTKWHVYILWSVLSLGLLGCALETHQSQFTRRRRTLTLGAPRSMRPAEPRVNTLGSDPAHLPDVSVTCSASDFVVRVRASFYGQGAGAEELTLGRSCRSTGILRPYGDLIFTYPLTACDAVRQFSDGFLVYKFVLHYEPSPKRFPSRAQRMDVDIECRYQRNHHVHQLTLQPTWDTALVRKILKGGPSDFKVELMDDSWSGPVKSPVYQLGKSINFQVSAPHLPTGGKLYINSCYISPSSGPQSSLRYTLIDNSGCMLDSQKDPGASRFVSRTDGSVRFSLKAFQFTSDPDTEVSIHCKLSVTSEEPGPAHKSCTYRGDRWKALTGHDSICDCCDSQCVTSKSRRAMIEGSASSKSMLVSDQPHTAEVEGFLPVSSISSSREGEATTYHYAFEELQQETPWDDLEYDDDVDRGNISEEEEEEEEQLDDEGSDVIHEGRITPEFRFRPRAFESEEEDSDQLERDGSGSEVRQRKQDEDELFDEGSELEEMTWYFTWT